MTSFLGKPVHVASDTDLSAVVYGDILELASCWKAKVSRLMWEDPEHNIIAGPFWVTAEVEDQYDPELNELEQELDLLLNDLLAGKPLAVSEDIKHIAKRIVQQRKNLKEVDVTAWARRLSDDIIDFD